MEQKTSKSHTMHDAAGKWRDTKPGAAVYVRARGMAENQVIGRKAVFRNRISVVSTFRGIRRGYY